MQNRQFQWLALLALLSLAALPRSAAQASLSCQCGASLDISVIWKNIMYERIAVVPLGKDKETACLLYAQSLTYGDGEDDTYKVGGSGRSYSCLLLSSYNFGGTCEILQNTTFSCPATEIPIPTSSTPHPTGTSTTRLNFSFFLFPAILLLVLLFAIILRRIKQTMARSPSQYVTVLPQAPEGDVEMANVPEATSQPPPAPYFATIPVGMTAMPLSPMPMTFAMQSNQPGVVYIATNQGPPPQLAPVYIATNRNF